MTKPYRRNFLHASGHEAGQSGAVGRLRWRAVPANLVQPVDIDELITSPWIGLHYRHEFLLHYAHELLDPHLGPTAAERS